MRRLALTGRIPPKSSHVYIETSIHASRITNFPANERADALDAALNALDDEDLHYPTVVESAYHDDFLIRFFGKDA